MATNYICDRCSEAVKDKELWVIVPFLKERMYDEDHMAKPSADLCESCKDSLMRDANRSLPRSL